MGKTRKTGDLVTDNNIFVNPTDDTFHVGTACTISGSNIGIIDCNGVNVSGISTLANVNVSGVVTCFQLFVDGTRITTDGGGGGGGGGSSSLTTLAFLNS
jgi:hypothetical protein|tara:strand:+ start:365 stop:664 length:300 start_codon:yes stop_codon:yes gene_type:complete